MAAIFFLFFEAQKLPKKPLVLDASPVVSKEGLWARAGRGLPVLGSTCVGLAALWRSFTIAMAWYLIRIMLDHRDKYVLTR